MTELIIEQVGVKEDKLMSEGALNIKGDNIEIPKETTTEDIEALLEESS